LSGTRQPEVDFFALLIFAQIFGQMVLMRVRTLSNTNLVRQGILEEERFRFRLACAAQKHLCLNTYMASSVGSLRKQPTFGDATTGFPAK